MSTAASYPGTELEVLSSAVNYPRWIIDWFRPYLGGKVAEVGAGIGTMSRLILECGAKELFAFEPSPNQFATLAERLADEPRATAINDYFRPAAVVGCDAVVYINVLEHIEHDVAEVQTAFEALRPGGHLLIFVPALSWLYSDFDRSVGHFRRYTRRGLGQVVSQAGFELVKVRYFDVAGIVPWYVNFVLLKNQPANGSVRLYDQLVVPVMRRLESVIPPPLGKNVLLIARKPVGRTAS